MSTGTASSSFLRNTVVMPRNGRMRGILANVRDPTILLGNTGFVGFQAWKNAAYTGLEARWDTRLTLCGEGAQSIPFNQCDLISVRYTATGSPSTLSLGGTAQMEVEYDM